MPAAARGQAPFLTVVVGPFARNLGGVFIQSLAEDGDPIENPSQPWPEDRTRVAAGTFVLERAYAEADGDCRDINFDPTVLPDGIAPSGDPVLAARAAAYPGLLADARIDFVASAVENGNGSTGVALSAQGKRLLEAWA